ncbi:ABC transporter substrate-binding protein [Paenibacillus apiarius]|uniref:ABC transporter substrate-binding protein n=1 Tax=Paenibacillus apiarius TaxID=46240 RepID=UPI003B3B36A5
MKQARKAIITLCTIALMGVLLAACGSKSDEPNSASEAKSEQAVSNGASPASQQAANGDKQSALDTRKFTDYKGHEVDIPVSPQRVIFWGETIGDLLPLGITAVGGAVNWIGGHVYEEQMKNVEDLGFPINLEKTLEVRPDLIMMGNVDEKEYEQLSKIAPTLMFNTFDPLETRLLMLGDILGKKQEAEQWLSTYNAKAETMWKDLQADGVKPGETATVLTYYPGDRLFVMATTGLSQVLYHPNGFKPAAAIQELLDANTGFKQISMELLPEFAGDRIFILNPVEEEPQRSTEELMKSKIWLDLPAVKQGHVYSIDILKSSSDATTRERLLEELPKMLKK